MADDQPAYERVADAMRAEIESGELSGRLPALPGLAQRYNTSEGIARQAVNKLRGEGLVVTRHGAGTYVRRFQRIRRTSPDRLSQSQQWGAGHAIQDHDTGPRRRVVDVVVDETIPPGYAAEALGVAPDQPVLFRSRRFVVEDHAVQLATSYLPLDIVAGTRIAYTDVGPGGSYARLAELGHAPVRFTERITARAPRPEEAERLDMASSVGALIMEIIRFAFDAAGRCVEVNRMVLDAASYELEYRFDA